MKDIDIFLGPRIPKDLLKKERKRFLKPTIFFVIAAILLLSSVFIPYWKLTLFAPQYPGGLHITTYINHVDGDVQEIDELNHYIGMRSMQDAAPLERSLSIIIVVSIVLLVVGSIYVHSPAAGFLAFPAILFPVIFIGDLYFWLRNFGTNLDPRAPLSNAVKPFVPPILGTGYVGQFKTVASWEIGLWIAVLASVLILFGLYFHRKTYKPLLEEQLKLSLANTENA